MVFFPAMLCLTFPAGIVGAFVGLLIHLPFAYFLNLPTGGAFFYFVAWLAMVAAGYWQWFVMVPRVLDLTPYFSTADSLNFVGSGVPTRVRLA